MLNLQTLSPEQFESLDRSSKEELLQDLLDAKRQMARTKLFRYKPYQKQLDFHAAGAKPTRTAPHGWKPTGKDLRGGAEVRLPPYWKVP